MTANLKRRLRALSGNTASGPIPADYIFLRPLKSKNDTSTDGEPPYACFVPGVISGAIGSNEGESFEDFSLRIGAIKDVKRQTEVTHEKSD